VPFAVWRQRHAHSLRFRDGSIHAGSPETTVLYQVLQKHLLTFEQQ
jgi:hypothetical protein